MIQAYFSPSRGMLRRIGKVGTRGQVRIVTASLSDNSTTIAAARSLYSGLFRHRVRIFEYLPCKLHMKLIVIDDRSEEHTSELQSLMRISYAVFCLKKKKKHTKRTTN